MDITCPRCDASLEVRADDLAGTVDGVPCPECGATVVLLKRPALPDGHARKQRKERKQRASSGARRRRSVSGRPGDLEERRARDRRVSRMATAGIAVLVLGGGGLFVDSFKSSGAYRAASVFVQANPEIRSRVGESMELNWFPRGEFRDDEARVRFHVEGPRGEADVALHMVRTGEGWLPAEAVVESGGERTRLAVPARAVVAAGGDLPSISRAWDLYEAGDGAEGLAMLDRRLEMAPGDPEALYWKGRMLAGMNRPGDALDALRAAVETRPDYPEAHRYLGYVLNTMGRHAEAVEALDAAIRFDPTNGWAYYNRGRALYDLGRRSDGLRDAREACRLGHQQGCEVSRQLSGGREDVP